MPIVIVVVVVVIVVVDGGGHGCGCGRYVLDDNDDDYAYRRGQNKDSTNEASGGADMCRRKGHRIQDPLPHGIFPVLRAGPVHK